MEYDANWSRVVYGEVKFLIGTYVGIKLIKWYDSFCLLPTLVIEKPEMAEHWLFRLQFLNFEITNDAFE